MDRTALSGLLRALAAFDAVARRGSITAAAAELGVAQSAVSRQIARLEIALGQRVFVRNRNGIRLTATGRYLAERANLAFETLHEALDALTSPAPNRITVGCSHGVASAWLMPRLGRMRSALPSLEVRLIAADDYERLDQPDIDVSIRFGHGEWPGRQSVVLFGEDVYAACAPSLIAAHPALRRLASAADLLDAPLLHLPADGGLDWQTWLRALGVRAPAAHGNVYPTHLTLLEAALDGEGVALCWRWLHDGYVARGRLVRLGNWSVRGRGAFYLLHRLNPTAPVTAFAAFLQSVATETLIPALA